MSFYRRLVDIMAKDDAQKAAPRAEPSPPPAAPPIASVPPTSPPEPGPGLAALDDLSKQLQALTVSLQTDRDMLKQSTEKIGRLERDLERFQSLARDPPDMFGESDAAPGRAADEQRVRELDPEAPLDDNRDLPLHVCEPGDGHDGTPHTTRGGVPDVPMSTLPPPLRPHDPVPARAAVQGAPDATLHQTYLAMDWFRHLLEHAEPRALHAFVDHYARLGWIDADAHVWLRGLAEGLAPRVDGATPAAFVADPRQLLTLHRDNLRFLDRLFRPHLTTAETKWLDAQVRACFRTT